MNYFSASDGSALSALVAEYAHLLRPRRRGSRRAQRSGAVILQNTSAIHAHPQFILILAVVLLHYMRHLRHFC